MAENRGRCLRTGGTNKRNGETDMLEGLDSEVGLDGVFACLDSIQALDNAWELQLDTGAREGKAGRVGGRGCQEGRGREGDESEARREELSRGHGGRGKETMGSTCDQSASTRRQRARTKHVAHAPADGNDGPTGYESDVEHAKCLISGRRVDTKKLGVKHFVYTGGPLRKTETYNPHCVADTWLAVLHDPGTYMGRVMYVTRESPMPHELELGGHKVFGTEQHLDARGGGLPWSGNVEHAYQITATTFNLASQVLTQEADSSRLRFHGNALTEEVIPLLVQMEIHAQEESIPVAWLHSCARLTAKGVQR
ncbi:hypothetical protein B0H11DRAFT_2208152 [Mycena galericulata]|nr:hypothetical protein B0H11DRAFT_2208152 [Mycena galericulata]